MSLHGFQSYLLECKKQLIVACSNTKYEYRSLSHTAAKIAWLQILLKDLHIYISYPPIIWCDNISAISLTSNPVFHVHTKYIEIDYHYVWENVIFKALGIRYISTQNQITNIFTKGLPSSWFQVLKNKLLIRDHPISLREGNDSERIQPLSQPIRQL